MITIETWSVVKENNPWKKAGECIRCGKCCYVYDKHPKKGGKRIACEHLRFENEIAVCDIYEDRPETCSEFPLIPYLSKQDKEWFKGCGYYFTTNIEEETHEAIKKLNIYCNLCKKGNKDFCPRRIKFLEDIFNNKGFDHICDGSCENCENKGKHQL